MTKATKLIKGRNRKWIKTTPGEGNKIHKRQEVFPAASLASKYNIILGCTNKKWTPAWFEFFHFTKFTHLKTNILQFSDS